MSWGLSGHTPTFRSWLFAWEQKLRRLPSLRDWSRANGFPEVGRRGRVPLAAIQAYRRRFRVLTPEWLYSRNARHLRRSP